MSCRGCSGSPPLKPEQLNNVKLTLASRERSTPDLKRAFVGVVNAFQRRASRRRVLAATFALGVSCWPNAGWTQTAISGEARTMSSNAAATNGLIEALSLHVRELSVKIGERSVLRGDGLDRAKT